MRTVEFPLESGGSVLVRMTGDEPVGGPVTRGMGTAEAIEQAGHTFESAMGTVRAVAGSVTAEVANLVQRPDELAVTFGLELSAKAGAVITAVGASAQLTVTLTWRSAGEESMTPA